MSLTLATIGAIGYAAVLRNKPDGGETWCYELLRQLAGEHAGAQFDAVIAGASLRLSLKVERLRRNIQRAPDPNHDLLRAIAGASAMASIQCAVVHADESGIAVLGKADRIPMPQAVRAWLKSRAIDPRRIYRVDPDQQLNLLIELCVQELAGIARPDAEFAEHLREAAGSPEILMDADAPGAGLAELAIAGLELQLGWTLSDRLRAIFRENWFRFLCANFQSELKSNAAVVRIFSAVLLGEIRTGQEQLAVMITDFTGQIAGKLDVIQSGIDALHRKVDLLLPPDTPATQADFTAYNTWLAAETGSIEIRGIQKSGVVARTFPITDLYVPLSMAGREAKIEDALDAQFVVAIGEPGSGKSTFLRRVAFDVASGAHALRLPPVEFVALVRIAALQQVIGRDIPPAAPDTGVIAAHLAREHQERGLTLADFLARFRQPATLLLLDGLDEGTTDSWRTFMGKFVERFIADFPLCRVVVTTRPKSYDNQLRGFEHVTIEPLDRESIQTFLRNWSRCVKEDDAQADAHYRELWAALEAKPEIYRMSRNPVMLTALAVVQWNQKRLPEERAELYENILTWLALARENQRRVSAKDCLNHCGVLALGMQDHRDGRQTLMEKGDAADLLAPELGGRRPAAGLGIPAPGGDRFRDYHEPRNIGRLLAPHLSGVSRGASARGRVGFRHPRAGVGKGETVPAGMAGDHDAARRGARAAGGEEAGLPVPGHAE